MTSSSVCRFVQDQVINHSIKPRTLQRRILCLKLFSKYCLKENYMKSDFTAGIQAPKADKNLPKYMTLQELNKLFTYLEQDPTVKDLLANILNFSRSFFISFELIIKVGVGPIGANT
jgi:site-specific recombinase XerD